MLETIFSATEAMMLSTINGVAARTERRGAHTVNAALHSVVLGPRPLSCVKDYA